MSKNTKSISLTSADIISIRKELDNNINKYWRIIRSENVLTNKAIKNGMGSGMDLKALYNSIRQMQEKRIIIKGILAAFNSGKKEFDKDEFKKSNNYSIFAAGEAKEAIAQLDLIPTINPTEKAKKGLKGTGKKETFTSAKIAQLKKELQLIANKHDAELEAFNKDTIIDITKIADEFKDYLTT